MLAKITHYRDYLLHVEKNLVGQTPPAWKHRKTLESQLDNIPLGALHAHKVPTWQFTEVLLDDISEPALKAKVEEIMKEVIFSQSPPTPRCNGGNGNNGGNTNNDGNTNNGGNDNNGDVVYDVDESMDNYEVPQFVPGEHASPSEIPADLFETPSFLKRRRLIQKTIVSPEHIPIHSGSSVESESLIKNERKRLAKSAAKDARAAAKDAKASASFTTPKKKGKTH